MDLGATVCHRSTPDCARCPVAPTCAARVQGQVSQYPQPRPRKAVPVRSSAMLLLLDQGEVMLEKRPAPGIWGGLWCFPEMPERGDPADHCASRFGLGVSRVESLAALRHGFTHFTLNIHPLVCHVERRSPHAAEPSRIWLPLEQAARSAIPVPVKKLLAQLRASL
jgi:A/G-specific adenine glycosylase